MLAALYLPVPEALQKGEAEVEDFNLGAYLALRIGNPPVTLMHSFVQARETSLDTDLAARDGTPALVCSMDVLVG